MTHRVARSLLAGACALVGSVAAHAAPLAPTTYSCPASAQLTVERDQAGVRVTFAGREYRLEKHRSDLGDKYLSSDAALIIDGQSAVFVAPGHLDVGTCVATVPLASAR